MSWIPADWPAPAGVHAGATTREGGTSTGVYASLNLGTHVGDAPAAVEENRARLRRLLRLPGEPAWLEQVHGTRVVDLARDRADAPADAAVCAVPGTVCAVLTADCLPVVLCSRDGQAVGVAHAGWRGLAAGVVEATVAALTRVGAPPADLLAWIGPCIGPGAYEVGDEVREAFTASDPEAAVAFSANARGRWQADLPALARLRLARVGVMRVYGGQLCTASDATRFYSHRRDGRCGRLATLVWRSR